MAMNHGLTEHLGIESLLIESRRAKFGCEKLRMVRRTFEQYLTTYKRLICRTLQNIGIPFTVFVTPCAYR